MYAQMCIIEYSNKRRQFEVSVWRLLRYQRYQRFQSLAIHIIVKLFLSGLGYEKVKRVFVVVSAGNSSSLLGAFQ